MVSLASMDPVPPEKRPRLSSWSSSTPSGVSLPHPRSQLHHQPPSHIHTQLPPPQPLATPPVHHQPPPNHLPPPGPGVYQSYPRPPVDQNSTPSTPTTGPNLPPPQQHPEADRGHHDQGPHAPMHDYYRQHPQPQPPPSPAHAGYPAYPSRDPPIKPDPHDDPRRPNSTGHAPDQGPHPHTMSSQHQSHQPPPPPPPPPPGVGASPHQQPPYPEHPRHLSYDANSQMPATPGGYRQPYPPTPITHQSSYEQSGPYGPTTDTFYSVYSTAASSKKKNTRASQACDQCRQLKAKCDETKPCKTCRDKGTECRYRDPVPKATDKTQADILEGVASVQGTLAQLTQFMQSVDGRLKRLEGLPSGGQAVEIKTDPVEHARSAAIRTNGLQESAFYEHSRDPTMSAGSHSGGMGMAEDEVEAEPGDPVPPGEPAIPINHTTLAGLLLDWPGIRDLTKPHLEKEGVRFVREFPISFEQKRGPLKVHGTGEASNHHSTQSRDGDYVALDIADDASDISSPSPAADWGQIGGRSPADSADLYRGGILGPDGNPDFSEPKVRAYVESFKDNMLNMHPLIQPAILDSWVNQFLESLPSANPRHSTHQPSRGTFATTTAANNDSSGSKRKRSSSPEGIRGPSTPSSVKAGRPYRSLNSALILTVLALGKICLHKDYIPDVAQPVDSAPQGSPVGRNGILPSPGQGSPPGLASHSQSSAGQPSPMDQGSGSSRSRRPSISGPPPPTRYNLRKNFESIPGLEYFALATDILGNFHGAYNSMTDVYCHIFAGLYHGQLNRPLESFAFINTASHKLQVLMRPSLDKMRKNKRSGIFPTEHRYNQIALTFWTCLQLESDLIAELPLPPSGLLSYEDDMPHPNLTLLKGFDQRIFDSYLGQLYLRTHLNSIHRMFYAPEDPNKPGKDKFKNVHLVSDAVSGMEWVSPSFAFSESDPPAGDILGARLRAKYWGAQGLTYRPFIRQILQFSDRMKNHPSSPSAVPVSEFRQDVIAPTIHPNTKSHDDIAPEVVELAKKGINALIESTRAFHGLGDKRPIITNIFGTSHAQWGNLLMLSAAYRDPVLHSFVPEDTLRMLFDRTIQFLRQSATATSSLRIDMHILEGLHRDLFLGPDVRANSSFSSSGHASHTPRMAAAVPPHVSQGADHRSYMGPPKM